MFIRIQQYLTPPVFADDEEKTRIAALLNTIFLIVLSLVALFGSFSVARTLDATRLIINILFILLILGMRFLLHRGYVRLSGFIFTSASWTIITVGIWIFGGLRGPGISSYFGIVLIGGLLLGSNASIAFAGLSILATLAMYFAGSLGILMPPSELLPLFNIWLEFATTLVGVTGLLYLAVYSLNRALARARHHEHELAHRAAETQQLAQEALEVNEFKSRLIARVSHELRTPLSAIHGLTEMLHYSTYGELSEAQQQATEKIIQHSQHLERLITELLEQSYFESRRLHLTLSEFSPTELLRTVDMIFHPLAQEKNLLFDVKLADSMPQTLHSDRQKIEQILSNLVSNAIKFTEVGTVGVEIYQPDSENWAIKVSDSGVGIAPEAQAYIFDSFRQADESPTRKYGGFGLGLALVKQLTTLMKGTVMLDSEVGQGTTFTVVLPLDLGTD